MAIAQHTPEAGVVVVPSLPKVQPDAMKSIVADDTYSSNLAMLPFVDGSQYNVNYYSQVLGLHSDLRELDAGQSGVYQQYNKIVNLELRVTSELTSSFNAATNMTLVTGSANVYPPLIPNVGDVFVANIGDGKDGIFIVKTADRKNFSRDSIYTIEYELAADITVGEGITRYADLESKVNAVTYYYKDFLLSDQNPNLVTADFKAITDLTVALSDITQYFFKTFFNRNFNTVTIPDQLNAVYDSRLLETVMRLVVTTDAANVRHTRLLNMDEDIHLADDCIWTAMLARDINLINYTDNRAGLVQAQSFNNNPLLEGYRFSGIPYAVYPIVSNPVIGETKVLATNVLTASPINTGGITGAVSNSYTVGERIIPLIKPVLVDDYYVLSSSFYLKDTTQSLLEVLVNDHLASRAVTPATLLLLVNQYRKWDKLEQYYYIPLVMMLIKAVMKGM